MAGRKPLALGDQLRRKEIGGGDGVDAPIFWPRTLVHVTTVPADRTMPVRDLVIADGAELLIEDGAEVLCL